MKVCFSCLALVIILIPGCTRTDVKSAQAVEEGNRLASDGKYAEAIKMYQHASQLNPRNGEAYYRLAMLNWNLGQGSSLESNLVRAVELQPSNMDALEKLGELYLLSYRQHNDVRWRQRYLLEMEQRAAQMLQLDSRSFQGRRINAYVAFYRGDHDRAVKLFDAALEMAPSSPQAPELAADKVYALLEQRRVEDAEASAELYLAANPSAIPVYDVLVKYYRGSNRSEAAIDLLRRKAEANAENASTLLELAGAYRAAGRQADAERTLDRIRSAPDRFPNGYELVADFYIQAGDEQKAMQALRAGEAQQPARTLDYRLKECELLARRRRRADAWQLIQSLGAPASMSLEHRIARQALVAQLGFPAGADSEMGEIRTLLTSAPRDARVLVSLARALQRQSKPREAATALERAGFLMPDSAEVQIASAQIFRTERNYPRMLDAAERALALDPGAPEGVFARGIAMAMLGQLQHAERDIDAAQRHWPHDPEVRHYVAFINLRQGRTSDAEAGFQKAAAAGYLPSVLALADLYIVQGRSAMALQLLEPLLSSGNDDPEIRLVHARAAMASGNYASAISAMRQLASGPSGNPSVSLELISALRRSGDDSGALREAREASQKYPRNPEVLARYAGLIVATGGSKAEAKALYEAAVREQPDHPSGGRLACLILETGGDRAEALTIAQRLSRTPSDDPETVACISRAFVANGLSEQAIRFLETSVQKQPCSAGLRLELAEAYVKKGDRSGGRAQLEAVGRCNPTPQQAAQARAAIEKLGGAASATPIAR